MTSHALLLFVLLQVCQLSLLVGFVWLITRTVTKNGAHLSYALWLVVLLKCFTPPVWSSPLGVFSWLHADNLAPPRAEVGIDEELASTIFVSSAGGVERLERPLATPTPLALSPTHDILHPMEEGVIGQSVSSNRATSQPVDELELRFATQLWSWIAAGWLVITLMILLWTVCFAQCCIRSLLRSRIADGDLQRKTWELCEALKLKSAVRLVVTSHPVGPAVIGLFRPTIVVPEFIVRRRTVEEMVPILAHELIHIRRGDLWIGMLRHLASSLWWFHPLVWKTSSSVRRAAEQCCDEEVIATLKISPRDYARALLSVLELKRELKTLPVVPGVRPIDITSNRMERIMRLRHGSHPKSPLWCWAIALLLALLSLPGAGLAVGDGREPPATTPSDESSHQSAPDGHEIGPAPPVLPKNDSGPPDKPTVMLECWFVTGRQRDIRSIPVDWQVMASSNTQSSDRENEEKHAQPAHQDGHGQSRVVTEKQLPIAYGILGEDPRALIKKLRGQEQFAVVGAPVITVPDSSSGMVHIGNQRPFIVGIQGGEHEVRTIDCGLTCQLRPRIQLDEAGTEATDISLSYELVTTEVLNIDEVTWRIKDGKGITVQIPETRSAVITGTNLIPTGKSLVIHGLLPLNANDNRESTLIVVHPKVMLPVQVAKADGQNALTVQGIVRDQERAPGASGNEEAHAVPPAVEKDRDDYATARMRAISGLEKGQALDPMQDTADAQYKERWKLTLDECIVIGLQNSETLRQLGVQVDQSVRETPDQALRSQLDSSRPGTEEIRVKKLLTRAEPDVSLTDAEIKIRNYLLEVTRSYWDLYFFYHNLQVARTGFAKSHEIWKTTASRIAGGLEGGEAANEAQARAQFFAFRSRQEQAVNELFNAESRLRAVLGLAATDGRLIQPIDEPTKARLEFDWEETKKTAIARRPEIRRKTEGIKQQASQLLAAREQLLTKINAESLHFFSEWEDGFDSDRIPRESGELTEDEFAEWQLGFEFQMPLGLRRELTQIRNAQLRLRRSEKVLDELKLEINRQLSAAVRRIEDQYQIAQTGYNAMIACRDQVESTSAALERSKIIQIDLLLEDQRNVAQSEVDFFRALAEYQQAIAELGFCKGTLIENCGYTMAEQKGAPRLDPL